MVIRQAANGINFVKKLSQFYQVELEMCTSQGTIPIPTILTGGRECQSEDKIQTWRLLASIIPDNLSGSLMKSMNEVALSLSSPVCSSRGQECWGWPELESSWQQVVLSPKVGARSGGAPDCSGAPLSMLAPSETRSYWRKEGLLALHPLQRQSRPVPLQGLPCHPVSTCLPSSLIHLFCSEMVTS